MDAVADPETVATSAARGITRRRAGPAAGRRTHVREEIDRFDLSSVLTPDRFYPTIRSAVEAYKAAHASQWAEPEHVEEARR